MSAPTIERTRLEQDLDTSGIWADLYQQILGYSGIQPSDKVPVCLGGLNLCADLGNRDPEVQAGTVYALGNVVPAWDPTYSARGSLFDGYSMFLGSIDPTKMGGDQNPNLISQINIAAAEATAAQDNFMNVKAKALGYYQAETKGQPNPPYFSDWLVQNYPVYFDAEKAMLAASSKYENLLYQQNGPNYDALQKARQAVTVAGSSTTPSTMNMQVKTGFTAPPGSIKVLPGQQPPAPPENLTRYLAPRYEFDSGFNAKYAEWQAISGKQPPPINFEVSTSGGAADWRQFGWSAGIEGSFSNFFVSVDVEVGSGGEMDRYQVSTAGSKLKVSFTGLSRFSINPGRWFNPTIVDLFRDKVRTDVPAFFGQDGAMSLRPSSVVIGFEPQIELHLEESAYMRAHEEWTVKAKSSLSIGPFRFGISQSSTSGSRDDVKWSNAERSIKVVGNSTVPVLLAVQCSKL